MRNHPAPGPSRRIYASPASPSNRKRNGKGRRGRSGLVGHQHRAERDQADADPVRHRKPLAEEDDGEDRHQHDAELVDRRDARGVAQLQGPEIAEPRGAGRQTRKDEEYPCAAGDRRRLLPASGSPQDRGEDKGDDAGADEGGEVGIDALDADLREDRRQRCEGGRQKRPCLSGKGEIGHEGTSLDRRRTITARCGRPATGSSSGRKMQRALAAAHRL